MYNQSGEANPLWAVVMIGGDGAQDFELDARNLFRSDCFLPACVCVSVAHLPKLFEFFLLLKV